MQLLDAERIFYGALFGIGLLVSVYAMLHGSVRAGRVPGAIRAPIAGFNAPVVGAALVAFGAVGYLVPKYSQLGTISTATLAIIAGAAGWAGMTVLMAKWALRGPLNDPHEELEELQGTVAVVTHAIEADQLGEIAYSFRGSSTTARARSLDGEPVAEGTEVVIDMLRDGVADVELWSIVEQRL